jgi:hypothetical protein
MKMKAYLRSGLRSAIAVTIALLTMVSPLCAPLCAATACASGNSAANPGADSCHHASASTADASGAIAAPQFCNLKELPAVALRDVRFSTEGHAKQTLSLQANTIAADESLTGQLSPSRLLPGSATSNDKPPSTTVLRI